MIIIIDGEIRLDLKERFQLKTNLKMPPLFRDSVCSSKRRTHATNAQVNPKTSIWYSYKRTCADYNWWRYRQTLINQAIYFGLISQTKKVYSESENDSLYHLTERGSKVLIACKNLYHSK